jgi:hypothetical protein
LPKAKPKPNERVPSAAELAARKRSLKFNAEVAESFGIQPGADPPREFVIVDALPDPPATEVIEAAAPRHRKAASTLNLDETVLQILREEMDELETRLERFGVSFTAAMKQDVTDHIFGMMISMAGGQTVGGGALARR